jgi:hypothetical protein
MTTVAENANAIDDLKPLIDALDAPRPQDAEAAMKVVRYLAGIQALIDNALLYKPELDANQLAFLGVSARRVVTTTYNLMTQFPRPSV